MSTARIKTPRDSQMETRYIVMPQHANDYGVAFGGTIMSWIDMLAAMVAQKHGEMKVVTVSIDHTAFLAPIRIGAHITLQASANYVGNTSMEVGVRVTCDNPYTGESRHATTAYLTFVGLDNEGHPTALPQLKPETAEDIRRHENAQLRVQARRELQRRIRVVGHI